MEDFLIGLIGLIAETLAEAFLEFAGGLVISILVRTSRKLFTVIRELGPILTTFSVVILGAAIGILSVWVFPHSLVHPSRIHGANLLISPIVTGLAMSQIGRGLRRRGRQSAQIESFGYGFVFAFAMAFVRFVFVR
jgi:hypothetical protein